MNKKHTEIVKETKDKEMNSQKTSLSVTIRKMKTVNTYSHQKLRKKNCIYSRAFKAEFKYVLITSSFLTSRKFEMRSGPN